MTPSLSSNRINAYAEGSPINIVNPDVLTRARTRL